MADEDVLVTDALGDMLSALSGVRSVGRADDMTVATLLTSVPRPSTDE